MRILHVGAFYPPRTVGGAERSVAMLAEAQVRAGHDVAAAALTPGAFAEEERGGVRVFRVPHESRFWSEDSAAHGALAYHWRKLTTPFNRAQRRHFERVLDLFRPDIMNTHSMVDVTTGVWGAARARGVAVAHTLRDYDLLCEDAGLYHGRASCGARCRVVSFAKQRQAYRVDGVAANSAETLRLHLEHGVLGHVPPTLQRVIWNISGLPDAPPGFVRPPRSGPFTFGYFGRITEEKGVGTLLDAAHRLSAGGWRLCIGGRLGPETERFREQATGLPVEWLGFVDAASFFAEVDVLIIPSIWPEPLPRTGLEAYAAGVPVLGSLAGGTPDLVGRDNADWLFAPGDVNGLANRMAAILVGGLTALPNATRFAPLLRETTETVVLERYLSFYRDVMAFRSENRVA